MEQGGSGKNLVQVKKIKQFFLCHVYDKNFQRSKNKRTLILRWASYLDDFSSYPLCT